MLIILFVLGFVYRLLLTGLVPQPFVFDQTEYHNFAIGILNRGIEVWTARLYGYPLFLSLVYLLFGVGNMTVVAITQAAVDCLTAILVYKSAGKLFNNTAAVISFVLYLFNPFTATFTGLVLSEVWAVFLMSLIIYMVILIVKDKKILWLPILGLVLGYYPQVRPAFLFYCFIILVALAVVMRRNVKLLFITGILFILPFTYNVYGNIKNYGQFSLTTADNLFVREFYISLYVPGRSPFFASSPNVFPIEVQKLYNEYSAVPKDGVERKRMAQKYLSLGLEKARGDPGEFLISRLRKMWYVWEKHFIFYYQQPENKLIDFLTYWGNDFLLLLAVGGFIFWTKGKSGGRDTFFVGFIILTIFYISAVHSISLAEERYSLPGYPLIFLFAGAGIRKIFYV